ncbi:RNA polymerase sigma-70 factor [Mucilaginibacter pedocola]|uniref:RNA polymerase sigma-70 factor n=1 Tax=Mucilaginibacter pedocola TaxID=1792845 RepID=A0A1S9PFS8_9SPHI|nr:RNA polymerase sigma-70 factor [Mucilaginibacter pedocola]OOQ59779.1 hypothetical protein BC343_06405 [Mucilaginibacter pedocola]
MCAALLQDDESLVGRLNDGDTGALAAIYEAYWYKLYKSAWALLKSKELAEDVVQEVFMQLWNLRGRLSIGHSLNAYLYASVRFQAFRTIKDRRLHEDIFDELYHHLLTTPALQDFELRELKNRIEDVVEQLPPQCKTVYKLSREEHLSHKQIAEQLHISTKAVEKHLTKALRVLRLNLRDLVTIEIFFYLLKK